MDRIPRYIRTYLYLLYMNSIYSVAILSTVSAPFSNAILTNHQYYETPYTTFMFSVIRLLEQVF